MRKLADALRLKFEAGQSHQQIARALGISKGVVTKYVGLAVAAGLAAIMAMVEAMLERRMLAAPAPATGTPKPTSDAFTRRWAAKASRSCCCGENTTPRSATSTVPPTPSSPGATAIARRIPFLLESEVAHKIAAVALHWWCALSPVKWTPCKSRIHRPSSPQSAGVAPPSNASSWN